VTIGAVACFRCRWHWPSLLPRLGQVVRQSINEWQQSLLTDREFQCEAFRQGITRKGLGIESFNGYPLPEKRQPRTAQPPRSIETIV